MNSLAGETPFGAVSSSHVPVAVLDSVVIAGISAVAGPHPDLAANDENRYGGHDPLRTAASGLVLPIIPNQALRPCPYAITEARNERPIREADSASASLPAGRPARLRQGAGEPADSNAPCPPLALPARSGQPRVRRARHGPRRRLRPPRQAASRSAATSGSPSARRCAAPVVRGSSVRPLFITAAGLPSADADLVRRMADRYRLLPDALRRAAVLARAVRRQPP